MCIFGFLKLRGMHLTGLRMSLARPHTAFKFFYWSTRVPGGPCIRVSVPIVGLKLQGAMFDPFYSVWDNEINYKPILHNENKQLRWMRANTNMLHTQFCKGLDSDDSNPFVVSIYVYIMPYYLKSTCLPPTPSILPSPPRLSISVARFSASCFTLTQTFFANPFLSQHMEKETYYNIEPLT